MDPSNPYAPPEFSNDVPLANSSPVGTPTLYGLIEKTIEFVISVISGGVGTFMVGGMMLSLLFDPFQPRSTIRDTIIGFLLFGLVVIGCFLGGYFSWRFGVKIQRHQPLSNVNEK